MNKYKIKITEELSKIVEIKEETKEKAIEKAKEMYRNYDIELETDDFQDVFYECVEEEKGIEEEINSYETICILNTHTEIQMTKEIIDFVKANFKEVKEIQNIGIKKLAYDIKQEKFGYYLKIEMKGTHNNAVELENLFRSNDNVLRFIIIKTE